MQWFSRHKWCFSGGGDDDEYTSEYIVWYILYLDIFCINGNLDFHATAENEGNIMFETTSRHGLKIRPLKKSDAAWLHDPRRPQKNALVAFQNLDLWRIHSEILEKV